MAGYTRTDTTNNIADGNIINATDLDNEFDGIQAAFSSSTGHNHDGTTGEGAPILVLGPTQDVVVGASTVTPKTTNTVDIGSSSLKYKDLHMAGNALVGGTLGVTGIATFTAQPVLSSLTASSAVATDASKGLVSVTNTGTGNNVLATSPTLVTPALGTPASGVVTNLTGTASININGTVGATTATTGAFTTLGASSTATLNTLVSSGATLTGGTINGMTVGATTASTGAFTSLTDSGNLAFTGTGNRITGDFSNATINNRVAFQGVSGSTTDVGSIPPSAASAASFIAFNSTDTGNAGFAQLRIDGSEARVASSRTGTGTYVPMVFYTGGSERARIDTSGNVGIGTSSPSTYGANLAVLGSGNGIISVGQATSYTTFQSNGQDFYLNMKGTGNTVFRNGSGDTERMRIDSSGNLLVGTTATLGAKFALYGTSGGTNSNIQITNPGYGTGCLGVLSTNSNFKLYNCYTSGTLGTGAGIDIDTSGKVGIGTTSPNTKLEVSNGALMAGTSGQVLLGRVSSSFPTTTTTGYFSLDTNNVDGTNGGLTIKTLASNVLTERLRINYLGDVGIGTSSPATRLHVAGGSLTMGAYGGEGGEIQLHNTVGGSGVGLDVDGSNNFRIFNVSNTATIFYTNSTERARITAAGDFLVGTTTNDNTTTGIKLDISPISGSPIVKSVGSSSSNSQDTFHVYSTGAGAYRFYVGYGGTISATSATITALSDQRLKENIQDLDVGLDKIMALQPRKFDWKAGKGTDKKGVRGFIAQEFEQVFPDLIDTWKDPAPEGEEPYKSVRADLIPVLVKAIQEQQALITTLTARVAALESN